MTTLKSITSRRWRIWSMLTEPALTYAETIRDARLISGVFTPRMFGLVLGTLVALILGILLIAALVPGNLLSIGVLTVFVYRCVYVHQWEKPALPQRFFSSNFWSGMAYVLSLAGLLRLTAFTELAWLLLVIWVVLPFFKAANKVASYVRGHDYR